MASFVDPGKIDEILELITDIDRGFEG
jgi:hypothetical protein